MKILHTISGLNISSGGPTSCTYNLIKGLRDEGIEADILTLMPRDDSDKIIAGDSFIKALPNDARTPLVYSSNFRRYLSSHIGYDLYHANGLWTCPTHFTAEIAKKQNKPCVIAPHGMLYPQALQVSAWKKKIVSTVFQRKDLETASCLQATCMAELEHIRAFGLNNPVAVIPNGLVIDDSLEIRKTSNSVRRFAFVGRLNRIKNVDLLLSAWSKLGDKTRNCELLIIGDGDTAYKKELEEFATANKLNNVRFLGFIMGKDLQKLVHSIDFQILPSKSENFGMVVPEALIQGVPVIASKGTPWSDLETFDCGWWVDNDIDTLISTLLIAINLSEQDRLGMGERGRTLVLRHYSIKSVSLRMKQLYEWLVYKNIKPEYVYE
ncbi:glycosyltransferase [Tannerella sp. AM09-19]|jgi:glycosyltransferase involved in cell wall biosynthesis|uniref:glycosyltransferase n=1 Tax=Coprobacter fastidiosus TaxID=1099853 RepID=UPI000EFFF7E6|nr:glycosyltransferase [Coprobacter fastidiosus]RHO57102.1 glycosyltransferase [Tannerella sp. AM09-19]